MNVEEKLTALRDLIQEDVANRGLRRDPAVNLITACADDFANACRSLAQTPQATVKIVTGFFIPYGEPPAAETDGPLGAVFLARALVPLGINIVLETDDFCVKALEAGLGACGLKSAVPVRTSSHAQKPSYWDGITHLLALERCGPNHNEKSLKAQLAGPGDLSEASQTVGQFLTEVPKERQDRYHTMRGVDVTQTMTALHVVFEAAKQAPWSIVTIGIGDGGNEIGMGKIPWDVIRRNIPGGGLIACRVPTDYLIVAGVSNWGAYALAAGVALLKGRPLDRSLYEVEREREILRVMVEHGPLVDGVTGMPTVTVDGLAFERYAEPLRRLARLD